ncbi:MAG: hypothetical protein DRN71_05325 [Candidatus Nanohalarchaeota archaeon]|nr:MAG: hypothetical protein DRN71_05325 [Candidatus Nanohaloarchaeota archaeon]
MRILYFGSYNKDYARNRVLIKGLKENNVEILECSSQKSIKTRFFTLIKKAIKKDFDIILVAYPGHIDMFPAKIISLIKRKPVIFDAFISTYDTMINEWKFGTRHSPKGIYYHWLDKTSCRMADLIIHDTEQHIDYFVKEFNLKRKKFACIPIGADETIFHPLKKTRTSKKFQILYYGHTNPLHGFPYIVEAAKQLKNEKDIEFLFIGDNRWFRYERDKNNDLENIKFKDAVPFEKIPYYIANADICLGIFGTTIKAQNVIPNKAYEILAMQKPLITADTKATRKCLKNKQNAILCKTGNAQEIAQSILLLKNNPKLKEKIAKNGYKLFKNNFTTKKIGYTLKKTIVKLDKKQST